MVHWEEKEHGLYSKKLTIAKRNSRENSIRHLRRRSERTLGKTTLVRNQRHLQEDLGDGDMRGDIDVLSYKGR
jgi:hypothetical protein